MPHPARHSRPHARRQEEAHALGSLLDTLHSPSDLVPPATAHRHSSQPEYTAPPSTLPPSSRTHAASVGLLVEDEEFSGRQRLEQQAPASARTAAQPQPPPEPLPAAPPASAGNPSPSVLVPPATAHRHSSQPEYTAPPSPLPATSSRIHATSVGLLAEDEQLSESQRGASTRARCNTHEKKGCRLPRN